MYIIIDIRYNSARNISIGSSPYDIALFGLNSNKNSELVVIWKLNVNNVIIE